MTDYEKLSAALRCHWLGEDCKKNCVFCNRGFECDRLLALHALDKLDYLMAFVDWIADKALSVPDDEDSISAEVVLRKLCWLGVVGKDGDKWVRREEEHDASIH